MKRISRPWSLSCWHASRHVIVDQHQQLPRLRQQVIEALAQDLARQSVGHLDVIERGLDVVTACGVRFACGRWYWCRRAIDAISARYLAWSRRIDGWSRAKRQRVGPGDDDPDAVPSSRWAFWCNVVIS